MTDIPLQAIRVFETVARVLSFTKAGTELNMTQSAISYQINKLEQHVGSALFLRKARGVELTSRGQELAPVVAKSLAELALAFRNSRQQRESVLTISTLQTLAGNWLAPRIGSFQLQHPELAVRIDVTSAMADFASDTVDVAIRCGLGEWPGLVAHHLFEQEFIAVASPAYLQRAGAPKSAADLLRHTLIAPSDDWWQIWSRTAGLTGEFVVERPGVDVETQQLAGSLAAAGHGIALITPRFERSCLANGQLVPLLGITATTGKGYYLVYPKQQQSDRKIVMFRDWVLSEATKD